MRRSPRQRYPYFPGDHDPFIRPLDSIVADPGQPVPHVFRLPPLDPSEDRFAALRRPLLSIEKLASALQSEMVMHTVPDGDEWSSSSYVGRDMPSASGVFASQRGSASAVMPASNSAPETEPQIGLNLAPRGDEPGFLAQPSAPLLHGYHELHRPLLAGLGGLAREPNLTRASLLAPYGLPPDHSFSLEAEVDAPQSPGELATSNEAASGLDPFLLWYVARRRVPSRRSPEFDHELETNEILRLLMWRRFEMLPYVIERLGARREEKMIRAFQLLADWRELPRSSEGPEAFLDKSWDYDEGFRKLEEVKNELGLTEVEWHHPLPNEFRDEFAAAGITDDMRERLAYWVWAEDHRLRSGGTRRLHPRWNRVWRKFFEERKNPTKKDIYDHLWMMMSENP